MLVVVYSKDAKYKALMSELIADQGHSVSAESSPAGVLALVRSARPQLLVLYNADGVGVDILRKLRAEPSLRRLPVLAVDPRAGSAETVALLDAGADDAITRPFQPPVFLARVRTLLRRAVWSGELPEEGATVLKAGGVELKLLSRQCNAAGRAVELTRLEFELLAQLLRHPDRAFKREELLASVWNYPGGVETRTLDKHVEALRRKLGTFGAQLHTVHGVGYRFTPAEARR